MRTVRCVSPHGGAHHGLRADNEQAAPPGYRGQLQLEPNDGGWVYNPLLGHVAVGSEVDAPDAPEFIADGFHFVDVTSGQGDVCAAQGYGCWCGQHRAVTPREWDTSAVTPPDAVTTGITPPGAVTVGVTPPDAVTVTGSPIADLLGKGEH